LIVLANELERAADYPGIARVIPLPELGAEHDDSHRILAGRSIRWDEPPAQKRWNAPVVRRVRRDVRRDDILGDITVGRGEVPPVLPDDALDGPRLAQLLELGAGHAGIAEAAGGVLQRQLHHAFSADVRKRIDQNAVDDAEHRARGADT
jgi:hypothetical protein